MDNHDRRVWPSILERRELGKYRRAVLAFQLESAKELIPEAVEFCTSVRGEGASGSCVIEASFEPIREVSASGSNGVCSPEKR